MAGRLAAPPPRALVVVAGIAASAVVAPVAHARESAYAGVAGGTAAGAPDRVTAWRAEIETRTAVFDRLPTSRSRPSGRLTLEDHGSSSGSRAPPRRRDCSRSRGRFAGIRTTSSAAGCSS
jgi:hypothetical protein